MWQNWWGMTLRRGKMFYYFLKNLKNFTWKLCPNTTFWDTAYFWCRGKGRTLHFTLIATGWMVPPISKLPFLNIITEVLLMQVPTGKGDMCVFQKATNCFNFQKESFCCKSSTIYTSDQMYKHFTTILKINSWPHTKMDFDYLLIWRLQPPLFRAYAYFCAQELFMYSW